MGGSYGFCGKIMKKKPWSVSEKQKEKKMKKRGDMKKKGEVKVSLLFL